LNFKTASKAIGKRYSLKRGSAVTDFIELLFEINELSETYIEFGSVEAI